MEHGKNINNFNKNKFYDVKVGDEIEFYNTNNIKECGIVKNVDNNIFTIITSQLWNKNGIIVISDFYYSFYKTGTKSNHKYNYGNAINYINKIK